MSFRELCNWLGKNYPRMYTSSALLPALREGRIAKKDHLWAVLK